MKKTNRERPADDAAITRKVRSLMGSLGWLLPETEGEVAAQEKVLEEQDGNLPLALQDPRAALRRPFLLDLVPEPPVSLSNREDIFARAAREGTGTISPEFEEQMRKDRKEAEARSVRHTVSSSSNVGGTHPNKSHISNPEASEIAELAEYIAQEYSNDFLDIERLVEQVGMTLSFGHYGNDFDGMLECQRGRFHIYCNLDRVIARNAPRARFTLAHELGHFFIDPHRFALLQGQPPHGSRCEYESKAPTEREADAFASHLLLPTQRFTNAARKAVSGLDGILKLAAIFESSLTATAIRYVQIDLLPCAVIKWNADGYGWKWISPTMFRAGYRRTIENRSSVPADSATGRVFAGEQPDSGKFHRCGSTAALWFPFISESGNRNAILWEEAIGLGRFGALTLLYPEEGFLQ